MLQNGMLIIQFFHSVIILKMKSQIYPSILFIYNSSQSFVSSIPQNQNIQMMHPKSPKIDYYVKSTQKIFNQIQILPQTLWIFSIKSTPYVKVYFAQSQIYPESQCCQQCVYILFNNQLNGSIICLGCQKKLSQFIYCESSALDIQNSQAFKLKSQQTKKINSQIRQIFSSNKFRTKNMKKLFLKLQEQRRQLTPSGGFILQIPKTSQDKQCIAKSKTSKNQKNIAQDEQSIPSHLESKRIIQQIFS